MYFCLVPVGILYIRNQSRVAFSRPGVKTFKSARSFNFCANGSALSIAIIFQSSSPSSIIARPPKTLTSTTLPDG